MLDELSTIFEKHGYNVELIPLAPGHAWNRTDARIAHLNTFFRCFLAVSKFFGAEGAVRILDIVCDPKQTCKRKFMERSHVFFLKVPKSKPRSSNIGCLLKSKLFPGGKMGVRGFLYFSFSFDDGQGNLIHPEGYARVREHGDPNKAHNTTVVYTWRKDLSSTMCQTCSNREGRPVGLSRYKCTKKLCKKKNLREEAAVHVVAGGAEAEAEVDDDEFEYEAYEEPEESEESEESESEESEKSEAADDDDDDDNAAVCAADGAALVGMAVEAWRKLNLQIDQIVVVNGGVGNKPWVGRVTQLLNVIYDANKKQDGDVEVHEYGNSSNDWKSSHHELWRPLSRKKDQRNTTTKTKGSTALRLVIWSESILFNADRKEILDANSKLTKKVLTKLVEFK